ncbi:MAG: HD domain-containing protein [Nitrospirae bacterium]|nr:MAG: HD domain-containing protein [Nitrospirota bacterium]
MNGGSINNTPLYNSRIIRLYLKLLDKNYPYVDQDALLDASGMAMYQVEDEGHWFTQDQIDRFYAVLTRGTGNKDIAREAGRFAASGDAIGNIKHYILGLVGPSRAYEMVSKYAANFSRSADYASRKIAVGTIEITVTPKKGVEEKRFQCENRIGFFQAIALAFDAKLPEIRHEECCFEGGACCRYLITVQKDTTRGWEYARNITGIGLLMAFTWLLAKSPSFALTGFLPFASLGFLGVLLYISSLKLRSIRTALENMGCTNDRLMAELNHTNDTALLVNEICLRISRHTEPARILSEFVEVLKKRLDFDRGMILLANEDETQLVYRKGYGYDAAEEQVIRGARFHLSKQDSKGVFVVAYHEKRPILVNNIEEITPSLSKRSLDFARAIRVKSFIACPIIMEDKAIGVLAVDNVRTKRPLLQRDINLLTGITPALAISLQNSVLIDSKMQQFKSIIRTLAASIDARDPLTAGHSEKVTEYTLGVCAELGLSREFREVMAVTALLHDYGKLAVRDAVLKKNEKLTAEEYAEIQAHAAKSREILEKIAFEGEYRSVPEIAEAHHEKVDGSGYPRGLKGDEIPLGARIIAVADFFDAITSKRHYREPMKQEDALSLVMEGIGSHFDREVAHAFIRYYTKQHGIMMPQKSFAHVSGPYGLSSPAAN